MEHRLKNQWRYKVELSTLLKIAITNNRRKPARQQISGSKLISALAAEAIISQAQCDKVETKRSNLQEAY